MAGASFRRRKHVDPELRVAALDEATGKAPVAQSPAKRKRMPTSEVDRLADKVLEVGRGEDDQRDFVERLGALLRNAGIAQVFCKLRIRKSDFPPSEQKACLKQCQRLTTYPYRCFFFFYLCTRRCWSNCQLQAC